MASARGGRWPPADVGRAAGGAMARHAGRRAGAGRQAGRQAGVSARNGARMRPCRRRPRWVVGGWHGRRRLIRLSMIGTASSAVDRDSLACVRCSPSRAPHGLAALGLAAALWRGAPERVRRLLPHASWHARRGDGGGGGGGGGSRERARVQGGCKASRGAARSGRWFMENSDIVCAAAWIARGDNLVIGSVGCCGEGTLVSLKCDTNGYFFCIQ
jgi:hypothetical protein